jgi:diguanylate cyclase (GGDEF)-like protein
VTALRWWSCAWASGVAALLLGFLAAASPLAVLAKLAFTLRLLCDAGQIYCVARGLLCLEGSHPKRTRWLLAVGLVLLLGFGVTALAGSAGPRVSVLASHNFVFSILCGVFAISFWPRRGQRTSALTVGSAIPLAVCVIGFLDAAALFRVLPGSSLSSLFSVLNWPAWTVIGQFSAALAMMSVMLFEAQARNAELDTHTEQLQAVMDSMPYGICEIDAAGSIKFANRAAATTLASDERSLAGTTIHDMLEAHHLKLRDSAPFTIGTTIHDVLEAHPGESSASVPCPPAFAPGTTIVGRSRHSTGVGDAISVEWSSSPIHRDGGTPGAVLTLRDITHAEAVDRFHQARCEILEMIAKQKSVEQTAHLLAAAIEQRLPGFQCSVLLCEGDWFHVVASSCTSDAFRAELNELPSSRFVLSGNRITDFVTWENSLRPLGLKHGFRGTWSKPMVSAANEVLGILVLNHADVTDLPSDEKSVLDQAASMAALAVEHRRSFERLTHQGHHDSLTGLPNRSLLEDRLKQALARVERTNKQLAILAIDLDRFKFVNDTFGHDTGDLFLQQISVRLSSRIRAADTLARTGGDEFTAILLDVKDIEDAKKVAESLTASLNDPFDVDGRTMYGAVSIGIAVYPKDGTDAESLRRNADRALYRAKEKGRNTVQCYSFDDALEHSNRIQIEVLLHRAIKNGNFEIHYQPQFTCDRQLVGFEALLRFRHPKLGMVPPSDFIPIAEESGLILPIGEWVLRETCRQIKEWEGKGMSAARVAVNASPLQFAQPDFCDTVAKVLRASKVQPDLLELEVTEGTLMQRDSVEQMEAMAALGLSLSVDDFGTGYSSLSYLHQLPIHNLKIDRSFISKMLAPGGTRSIVEAIISLAHGLRLKTIAEGVETQEQLAFLRAAGCDFIQGYIFSHPLSAIEASRLLWQHTFGETRGGSLEQSVNPKVAPGLPR